MAVKSFQEIVAWQKARLLTIDIYKAFSTCRDFSFKDQIQRATISITNNIAEGYAKRSNKSFKNYLFIAKGSAAEVESMLIVAVDLGYLTTRQCDELLAKVTEVSKLLQGFIRKI